MTQSSSSQLLGIELTPMKIPESVPPNSSSQSASWKDVENVDDTSSLRKSLLLSPGEPSEMVVHLRNNSSCILQLGLRVQGDFPQEWCKIGMEGSEVLPNQHMEAVIYFQIPPNFFEDDTVLSPGESLKLNYVINLYAEWIESDTFKKHVEHVTFNLYIRSSSLYLNFLPATYRDVDFIGRFLKICEQSFEPSVNILDNLWAYLDPLTAPQAFLPFLSHWVAWQESVQIDQKKQRQLIKNAIQIYQWRGTRRGLRFYLHLATNLPLDEHISDEAEKHISITENFSKGLIFGEAKIGEDSVLGGELPFHFTVNLRPGEHIQIDEKLVKKVIEQEKPAFCTYELYINN
ncbi:MAG: phage tail protein [Mastigocoleus sp.]